MNTIEKRNIYGLIGWFVLTLILSFVITLPTMIGREYHQYKKYLKPCNIPFEWDDVKRYSIVIVLAEVIRILARLL